MLIWEVCTLTGTFPYVLHNVWTHVLWVLVVVTLCSTWLQTPISKIWTYPIGSYLLIPSSETHSWVLHVGMQSMSPLVFYVSALCFVSWFCFTSHFHPPCSIPVPEPLTLIYAWFSLPWHVLLWYIYVPNLMYVLQSEINIDCPSNSLSEPPNSHLILTLNVWWHST